MATERKTAAAGKRPTAARRAKAGPVRLGERAPLRIKVILHAAEEGGFWAEVPALPGCVTEGATVDETLANVREAIVGCLSIGVNHMPLAAGDQVHEVEL